MTDSPYPPISDYALLSDCHSCALVSTDGSIDWCVPPLRGGARVRPDPRLGQGRLLPNRAGGRLRFLQSFGDGGKLDASNLMIPIVGFVEHTDPRAKATVDLIASDLSADGFVYRYVTDGVDGLSGDEATFAICSFWLVECLAQAGEVDRARELFERLISFSNDVGLLAEEIDPHSGEILGNFPQAFSHLGLIQAATALDMPEKSMTARAAEGSGAAS